VLLLPLLVFMERIASDEDLMGAFVAGRAARVAYLMTIAFITVCVTAMVVLSVA